MKRSWLILLGIVLFALVCRAPWAMQPRSVRWDEADYLILAQNLLRGDGYQVFGTPELTWPPVVPVLAATALAAGVPVDYALPLWHVLLGALACGLLFGLARTVTGDTAIAAIAGLLAAATPSLTVWPLYWGSLTESAFLVCLLAGLWATWRVLHGGGIWAALGAGCAFGIGYLIRTESLLWWVLLLGVVLLQALRRRLISRFALEIAAAPLRNRGFSRLLPLTTEPAKALIPGTVFPSAAAPPAASETALKIACCGRSPAEPPAPPAFSSVVAPRPGWGVILAFALSFTLWVAPYVGYLHHHTGRWMLSSKTGINVLMSPVVIAQGGAGQDYAAKLDSTGAEILWLSSERFDVDWLQIILADPVAFLRQIWANVRLAGAALVDPLLGRALLLLIPLGLLGRVWDRRRARQEAFWALALAPLAVLFVTKIETRYLAPLIPVALIWAARAILHLGQWLAETVRGAWARRMPVAAVSALWVVLLLATALGGQLQTARIGQASLVPSHEAAGRWLAEHAEPGAPVMARDTEIALYAGLPVVAFPAAAWDAVAAYGRARAARYLVTDDWEVTQLRPQLAFLDDPATAPAELEHLVTFTDARRTTYVYRWVK